MAAADSADPPGGVVMNEAQHGRILAELRTQTVELRQQSEILTRIADRLSTDADVDDESDDRGEDYRPVAKSDGVMAMSMWLDQSGEPHWVPTFAGMEFNAQLKGWKRVYVRRDGR